VVTVDLKKVVIIDSGLSESFINENANNLLEYKNFCETQNSTMYDTAGHGTAVASIIHSINKDVKLIIIKIYDDVLVQDESVFIKALSYILESKINDALIHMSLGVSYYNETISNLLKEIILNNNVAISAFDNTGCMSYPAAFNFVIGVESSELCIKPSDFFVPDNSIIDVFSKGGIHKVSGINKKYIIKSGNSLSAAYVTGYLSTTNITSITKENSLEYLSNISTYKHEELPDRNDKDCMYDEFDKSSLIKKAIVFPYNKETKNLIRFSSLLPFEISDIYTSKYLGNIGRIVENRNRKYTIKSIENIEYNDIDTMILGHLSIVEKFTKIDYKKKVIEECLKNKVNVFMLDDKYLSEYYDKFKQQGNFIYAPTINYKLIVKNSKLYKLKSPIVCIFGTSSKQGKYTLQLNLRQCFLDNDYKVAQLSTEPNGPLFGIEATVPFGFDSNNYLSNSDFISYININLHQLDITDPDLIITGSQSHTIPLNFDNIGCLALRQIEFLIAVNPDAAILCINPDDSVDYISRTIQVIESLTSAKVLCLALFPFIYKNEWKGLNENIIHISDEQINQITTHLKQKIKLAVFSLDKQDNIQSIAESIVDFF
jgi:uncharacterized NAD-dependent epimerase/dehydratase family protein